MPADLRVGRVLRANSRSFVVGCSVMREDIPAFGALIRADSSVEDGVIYSVIYGLIYDVALEDDPFVRQLVVADLPEEVVRDQRRNRQVPIEVSVLAVGWGDGDAIHQSTPAQPPVMLDWLHQCQRQEVVTFTQRFDYFRLVLGGRAVPADQLLAANLRMAAAARPTNTKADFLLRAGRELVRLLAHDPIRLESLLRQIRP